MRFTSVDIFCHVIDNFGDIGVVYRFAKEFKLLHPLCRLRVFCNDLSPLSMMLPGADPNRTIQEVNGITYVDSQRLDEPLAKRLGPADVVIEAFGCDIPEPYRKDSLVKAGVWINLEYLSAEPWVGGYHQKPSLVLDGAVKKYFYMPGFTEATGGVIVDSQIEFAKPALGRDRLALLNTILSGFKIAIDDTDNGLFAAVFTYLRGFDALLADLTRLRKPVYLFICGDKSRRGIAETMLRINGVRVDETRWTYENVEALLMPFMPQRDFDRLLCITDFNLVRGEDSLVRAILSEKPFLWNAYLQKEKYHHVKVEAFLEIFRGYFEHDNIFAGYRDLLMDFNDGSVESARQTTNEHYGDFLDNLNKIEHATRAMSYFMTRKCSLVERFSDFLSGI